MATQPTRTTLRYIKQHYCENQRIKDPDTVELTFVGRNTRTGDATFWVNQGGAASVTYSHPRLDMKSYNGYKGFGIPQEYRRELVANPSGEMIAQWVNRFVNINLMDEDIARLLVETDGVTVIIRPDSMRFKNHFKITFL